MTIDGTGSQWNLTGATNDVVGDGGTGTLTVSGGATFSDANLTIAKQSSSGTAAAPSSVTVTGTGSKLNVLGTLTIGQSGAAALTVSGGAQLQSLGDITSGTANINLQDANTMWSVTGSPIIELGANGNTTTLTVQSGATLSAAGSLIQLGNTGYSANDVLQVTGSNSTLTASSLALAASGSKLLVNVGGSATLTGNLTLYDGSRATVDGASANLTPSSLTMAGLTFNGAGVLTISNGAAGTVTGNSTITVGGNGDAAGITVVGVSGNQIGSSLLAASAPLSIGSLGNVSVTDGGRLTTAAATLSGSGSVSVGAGSYTSHWAIQGTGAGLSLSGSSRLSINVGGTVSVAGQTAVQGGNIVIDDSGTSTATGLTSAGVTVGSGSIQLFGGSLVSNANGPQGVGIYIGNDGALLAGSGGGTGGTITTPSMTLAGMGILGLSGVATASVTNGLVLNGGSVSISSTSSLTSGTITVNTGGSIKNGGQITATTLTLNSGGSYGGTGNFKGSFINAGKVAPGDPQTTTITGNYTQQSGGLLDIAIAGSDPAESDHLMITGEASLASGSVLELDFIAGYAPKTGAIFDFLSYGSLDANNKTFGTVDITGLAPGFEYSVQPDPNNPGDYELLALNDGIATSVPEPSTWVLLLGGASLAGLALHRQRRAAHRAQARRVTC